MLPIVKPGDLIEYEAGITGRMVRFEHPIRFLSVSYEVTVPYDLQMPRRALEKGRAREACRNQRGFWGHFERRAEV